MALLTAAVAGVVSFAHWPALSAKASAFDDAMYLGDNVLVRHPSWESVRRFLTEVLEPSTVRGYYQPLTMISLMLDHAMGGSVDNFRPFHRTSLLLHAANSVLVVLFLYVLFGQPWVAALVGLLFGVHPMTVENIPWIGERKTLLASFLALWCLIAYVRFAQTGGRGWYVLALAMYVLALLAKPTAVPLAVVLLLLDFWPLGRLDRPFSRVAPLRLRGLTPAEAGGSASGVPRQVTLARALWEKTPFLVIAITFAVITYISQHRTAGTALPLGHAATRVPLILCHNIIFYLHKMVWPVNLLSDYPVPRPLGLAHPAVLAGVVGTGMLIPALILSLRWTRALLTGGLIFFLMILPTMGIIGFTSILTSDKYAYLPAVGVLMVLAWFLIRLWGGGRRWPQLGTRVAVVIAVAVLAALEIRGTRAYLAHWQDSEKLFRYFCSVAPDSARSQVCLARVLMIRKRYEEALLHVRRALELDPEYYYSYYVLGAVLLRQKQYDEAIAALEESCRREPAFADARNSLGVCYWHKGDLAAAEHQFATALRIFPYHAQAHVNMSLVLARRGQIGPAMEHCQRALAANDRFADAYFQLGELLEKQDRRAEALAAYRRGLQIQPDDKLAQAALQRLEAERSTTGAP